MNSCDPLNENKNKNRVITDNLSNSNEMLNKEVQLLLSLKSNTPKHPLSEANEPSINLFDNDASVNSDFLLIINHLNKVIYADQNGLRLWAVTSTDLIPIVNLSAKPQSMSHNRTMSAKLVLHKNKIINVLIEELNFSSAVTGSPDVLFLIRPHKNKFLLIKSTSPDKLFSTPDNTVSLENDKPLHFKAPIKLVKNAISDKSKASENQFDLTIKKKLADKLPLQILLVEDNLINQKLIILLLKKMGYCPDTSMNGAEAVKMLEKKRYDIVFMDVQMPVMDGLEATRTIISNWPKNMRPHIVAMTANVMHGDREKCLDAGMDDYLSKPLRINEIEDVLMKWGTAST